MNVRFVTNFRTKLLFSFMLIVLVVTGVTSYIAERNAHARYQEGLDGQFQAQMRFFMALHDARRTAILERCRAISHSVRLRAALEEEDVEDLYRNAFTELQGIYDPAAGGSDKVDPQIPRAMFFRFLDAHGAVLSPGTFPVGYSDRESLDLALAPMGRALPDFGDQTVGYLALNRHNDLTVVCEVVVTKIIGWEGKQLGALVLAFPVRDVVAPDAAQTNPIVSGIWLSGRLYMSTKVDGADRHLASVLIGDRVADGSGHFPVELGNAPYLLFYKALDPKTQLAPAYEVCFYPLSASLRHQQALRSKIAGFGGLVLLVGFVASLFLAKGLSKPVDKIMAGSMENLTLRRQAERDLLETNRELEKALEDLKAAQQQVIQHERLRALGQMASGVAHDFNNTLTPIVGFADLLLEREDLLSNKAETTTFLKLLRTSALDAANVVRRLREFYRPLDQHEELAPVDLTDLIAQVIALTEPRWRQQAQANGATIRIEKKLETLSPVAANESALREALTNLVFNAVDAMPSGGMISFETGTENGQAVIRVRDTGSGMTEAVRRRCLEPFFSTKGEHGTGLGLAMVYGIVERHRGDLKIESAPGDGTTFVIRLPLAEPTTAEAKVPEAPEIAKSPLNVLVVDDEPGIREVIAAFLRSDGHEVTTASNGREGLEQFESHPFDMVVTDRAMPEMNGDQMAGLIKESQPDIPVVLLTGFGTLIRSTGVQPPSIDAVLDKPVTLKTLLSTIENLRHAA